MMNENLKYPLDISRYHDPSTGANSSDRYTCASSIGNGYSGNGTPECNLTNDLGYLYTGPTAQLACPT